MGSSIVAVNNIVIKKELSFNGEILLTYSIEYPELRSLQFRKCLQKVNRYYRNAALKYMLYIETVLFKTAVEQYKESVKNAYPIRVFDVVQTYQITCLHSCILSLYFDRYEYTGGAHGNTIRQSQTWQLQKCRQIKLKQLIICPPDYKAYILNEVKIQIQRAPDIYFEDYNQLTDSTFNGSSFYCTPDGIVIYYQQYDIAPYSSGIREFIIPFRGCVINPQKLCQKLLIKY